MSAGNRRMAERRKQERQRHKALRKQQRQQEVAWLANGKSEKAEG